jgi:hypothetical protein
VVVNPYGMMLFQLISDPLHADHSLARGLD